MARPIEHHDDDILDALVQRLRDEEQRLLDRALDLDRIDPSDLHVLDHLRPVRQLHHIEGRNIAQRDLDSLLRTSRRDTADRIRRALRDVGRAVDGIERDVERRRPGHPCAELFAFENAGRIILDPLADDDFAADVHKIEHAPHRIARGFVRFFLFAAEGINLGNLIIQSPVVSHEVGQRCIRGLSVSARVMRNRKFETPVALVGLRLRFA